MRTSSSWNELGFISKKAGIERNIYYIIIIIIIKQYRYNYALNTELYINVSIQAKTLLAATGFGMIPGSLIVHIRDKKAFENNNDNNNKCPGYDKKLHPVVELRRGIMRLPLATTTSRSPLSKV